MMMIIVYILIIEKKFVNENWRWFHSWWFLKWIGTDKRINQCDREKGDNRLGKGRSEV